MNDSQGGMHRVVLLIILLIFCESKASPVPNAEARDRKFTLDLCDVAIVKVFKEMEKASDYVFAWPVAVNADIHKQVSIRVKGVSLAVVMEHLLADTGLTYRLLDKQIVIYREERING